MGRYTSKGTAAFLMLNPSTADATLDDPTIRRCRGFADSWDCNGIVVVNIYGLRSTDPSALWKHPDPVGPENDYYIRQVARECGAVVCAWGVNAKPERIADVVKLVRATGAELYCLGVTKDGHPKHPLYLRKDSKMMPWPAASGEKGDTTHA
jgi:hypothetical protein